MTYLPRQLILLILLAFSLGLLLALAEGPPAPNLNDASHEVVRLKLLTAFQRALLAQRAAVDAQQQFESARADYTRLADETSKELKLPPNTEFRIDANAGKIEVVLPQPPPKSAEGGKK